MASRRPHKKSRTGCATCRRRRIKCDELHPQCSPCRKHGVVCDYALEETKSNSSTPVPSFPRRPMRSIAVQTAASYPPAPTVRESFLTTPPLFTNVSDASSSTIPSGAPIHSNMDVMLMHHFTVSTAHTTSNRPAIQLLWSHMVPPIGYTCSYVMHSMLAFAALHLSSNTNISAHSSTSSSFTSNRSRDFLTAAADHHNAAVREIAKELTNIHRENCDSLFVASSMVVVYSFFATRLTVAPAISAGGDHQPALWMPFLRGVHGILAHAYDWVSKGPFATMVTRDVVSETPPPEIVTRLDTLFQLCTDRSLPDGGSELEDAEISATYCSAITKLQHTYSCVEASRDLEASIFSWGIVVGDHFVDLLKLNRPRALIIWAHYCLLFKKLNWWWAEGASEWELVQVERCLPESWWGWLEWPRMKLREEQQGAQRDGPVQQPGLGATWMDGADRSRVQFAAVSSRAAEERGQAPAEERGSKREADIRDTSNCVYMDTSA